MGATEAGHSTRWSLAWTVIVVVVIVFLPRLTRRSPRHEAFNEFDEDAVWALASATSQDDRFYALDKAARVALKRGRDGEARTLAEEVLALAGKYRTNWNYGNAIHHGNIVLGGLALRAGRIEEAKSHLLEAGRTPGSPQLDTFGPNMSLARDLIERGEREVVLEYFELCRVFWDSERARLDKWSEAVKAGRTPEFGVQLVH